MHTNLWSYTNEKRTDIECCATFVGRNPFLIKANNLLYHFLEHFCRNLWHHNTITCALKTFCIILHSEYTNLTIRTTISLQTFESLLTIMQTGSSHVHVNVFVGAYLYLAPFSVTIVAADIVICSSVAKRKTTPV